MNITSTAPATVQLPTKAPVGWTPQSIQNIPSSLGDSMFPAIISHWQNKAEKQPGQRMSEQQVATLAPFLADKFAMPAAAVADALTGIEFYVGGAIKGTGMDAITLRDKIYLGSEAKLQNILSWKGRRFLAHEVGHVLQRERVDGETAGWFGGGELGKTRAALASYVGGVIVEPGAKAGALAKGVSRWIGQHFTGDKDAKRGVDKLMHDAHRLEVEVEEFAQDFRRRTSG